MEKKKQLIVLQGPTASGKTALSIALAQKYNCSILSADSRQFYKEISLGTAKPTLEEREDIPHFFIDSHSITQPVSAAQFEKEGLEILAKEFAIHEICILVGGSGLFIDALCEGLDPLPTDASVQEKWKAFLETNGLEKLQEELKKLDPDYYQQVDKMNPHRVLRALEIINLTGQKMADVRKKNKSIRPFEIQRFVVNLPREKLYQRIDERVHQMIENGLLLEAKTMLPFRQLQSLNTVGYKELFSFFDGKIDLTEAIRQIQQNSRRYAKRQLTWFRRNPDNHWLQSESTEDRLIELGNHLAIE